MDGLGGVHGKRHARSTAPRTAMTPPCHWQPDSLRATPRAHSPTPESQASSRGSHPRRCLLSPSWRPCLRHTATRRRPEPRRVACGEAARRRDGWWPWVAASPRKKVEGPPLIMLAVVSRRPVPLRCCWIMISSIGPHTCDDARASAPIRLPWPSATCGRCKEYIRDRSRCIIRGACAPRPRQPPTRSQRQSSRHRRGYGPRRRPSPFLLCLRRARAADEVVEMAQRAGSFPAVHGDGIRGLRAHRSHRTGT